MDFCQDCGNKLEYLGKVPGTSSRHYYGCENCDSVYEEITCCFSGRTVGSQKTYWRFSEAKKRKKEV